MNKIVKIVIILDDKQTSKPSLLMPIKFDYGYFYTKPLIPSCKILQLYLNHLNNLN